MAGSSASPVAVRVEAAEPFRDLMGKMIETFEMRDHTILAMLVDGNKAAVH
jgi:hypothetical protein